MSNDKEKKLIVLNLIVENIGPIKRVEVQPDGDLVYLTGPNGAGKTTALDAMKWALEGGRSFSGIDQIVRDGADQGEVEIDLGDYVIRRTWKSDHDYRLELLAKMADGTMTKVDSAPQSVIDAFGDTIGFDPLWYSRTSGDERIEYLKTFIDFDFDRLEHEIKKIYEERRDIGRDKRNAEERLKAMDEPAEDPDREKIDVSETAKELNKAKEYNAKVERAEEKADEIDEKITNLEIEIQELQEELDRYKEDKKKAENWLEENERKDTEELEEKLDKAEEINEEIRQAEKYYEIKSEVDTCSEHYDKKTEEIEEKKAEKRKAIEEAKFPISGLEIGEDDIYIDDRAFGRLSEGERLKYASLLVIGTEPRFKVLAVREGEKLDSKNEQVLKDVAREHGFQLWIEKMDESGEVGFVFENGQIVKQNEE